MSPRKSKAKAPQLLTIAAAAELLSVSTRTIHNWIQDERIPYIKLPAAPGTKQQYRIPQHALLSTLGGNYNLAADLVAEHEESGFVTDTDHVVGHGATVHEVAAMNGSARDLHS